MEKKPLHTDIDNETKTFNFPFSYDPRLFILMLYDGEKSLLKK